MKFLNQMISQTAEEPLDAGPDAVQDECEEGAGVLKTKKAEPCAQNHGHL